MRHTEVIHAEVCRLLLTWARNSRFGSHIRIQSQLTTDECHKGGYRAGSAGFLTELCPPSHYESTIEHYPSGSVVARVLLTANPSVYTPVDESIAHWWREKEMIQPHPLV